MSTSTNYADVERTPLLELVSPTAHTILDIGCNKGAFGAAIKKQRTAEVWGVEPDTASAKIAAQRLDQVINDIFDERNPIPDKHFDLITFNDSLEHMADAESALLLSKNKLKADGIVQCCVPNVRHISNLEHLIFEKDWHYEEDGIRDKTHLRFFTRKSIVDLFQACGYQVENVVGINEKWWAADKKLRRLFFKLLPNFTADMRHIQYVVIAKAIDK